MDPIKETLERWILKMLEFVGSGTYKPPLVTPDLSDTEQALLDVISEPRFTAHEKATLVDDYFRAGRISFDAVLLFTDRIELIESLKVFYNNYSKP